MARLIYFLAITLVVLDLGWYLWREFDRRGTPPAPPSESSALPALCAPTFV